MANKPISTSPTTMGKHGRLREEEAKRDEGVKFAQDSTARSQDKLKTDMQATLRNAQDQRAAKEAPKPTTHGLPSAPADVKPAEAPAPKPVVEAKPAPEPADAMSLADVNAILADNYPGFEPTMIKADATGLTFPLPGGRSIKVERSKVKKCANMEELRAYIDSVK